MDSVACLQYLPVETLADILRHLSEADLRRTAATSRHLRGVALEYAGMGLRFRCLICYSERDRRRNYNRLREAINYARSQCRPLDLVFDCYFVPSYEETAVASVCLFDALPLLFKLSLDFVGGFPLNIWTALSHNAPQLRELRLCGSPIRIVDGIIPPPVLLPATLFSGSAPQLTTLDLHDIFLSAGAPPLDIFKHILDLKLSYNSAIPRLNITRHFPSVRTLEIRLYESCPLMPGRSPAFALRGLALDSVTLKADPDLMQELDEQIAESPRVIPSVRRYVTARRPYIYGGRNPWRR